MFYINFYKKVNMTEKLTRMTAVEAEAKLVRLLLFGGWKAGERLPAEQRLADEVGCNYHTVRKAIGRLVEVGVLERRVGSGCYLLRLPSIGDGVRPAVPGTIIIGVLLPIETGRFFDLLLGRMHTAAAALGAELVVRPVTNVGPETIDIIYSLQKQRAVAVIAPRIRDHQAAAALIHHSPLPIVLAERILGLERNYFELAEKEGHSDGLLIEQMTTHLLSCGWREVAFVGPDAPEISGLRWRLSYFHSLQHRRGAAAHVVLSRGPQDMVAGLRRLQPLRGHLGLLCFDDYHAFAALEACAELGWKVPHEIGVLGVNNEPAGEHSLPPLSTIAWDYGYLAEPLVRHALAMARGGTDQATGTFTPSLVLRASCGGARSH